MTGAKRRSVLWVLLGAVALGVLVFAAVDRGSGNESNADRSYSLAKRFACPVCTGQSVAESDAPLAREIRKEIAKRVDEGQTNSQIRDYLIGLYGEEMDLKPKSSGVTGLVWVIPVVAFITAAAGLAAVFRKWKRDERVVATDADREVVARARGAATR